MAVPWFIFRTGLALLGGLSGMHADSHAPPSLYKESLHERRTSHAAVIRRTRQCSQPSCLGHRVHGARDLPVLSARPDRHRGDRVLGAGEHQAQPGRPGRCASLVRQRQDLVLGGTAFAIIGLLLNIVMLATGGMEQYMEMMQQMQQMQ